MTDLSEKTLLLSRFNEVKNQIEKTCLTSQRNDHTVKLIVVTKGQPITKIRWLIEAGHHEFAENRLEELEHKWSILLKEYPDTKLHFIGHIQSRKIKKIVQYCHVIHSLDRIEIAKKIAMECHKQHKNIPCLIQINTGHEPQKDGIDPNLFSDFLQQCNQIPTLNINGIMCIPPANQDASPHFHLMQQLKNDYHLNELSMGMSNDYTEAILLGSTMLRIGTKIMGERH